MIAVMAFGTATADGRGRSIAEAAFVPRSTLPLSAACLVANGVREALARLLARDVEVELLEPAMPGAAERRLLLDDATVFRVRGRICDGFVIVRCGDARRLVAVAFGETERPERDALSDIERTTLERIVAGLLPLCNTLCGTLGPVTLEAPERAASELATYFEVRTSASPQIAIGFALTRDPCEDVAERISLADLADVELPGAVTFGSGSLTVPAFSRLAPGATIALDTAVGGYGTLRFGDVSFAQGVCGVSNGRSAFDVAREADDRTRRAV